MKLSHWNVICEWFVLALRMIRNSAASKNHANWPISTDLVEVPGLFSLMSTKSVEVPGLFQSMSTKSVEVPGLFQSMSTKSVEVPCLFPVCSTGTEQTGNGPGTDREQTGNSGTDREQTGNKE